jgi:cytochrome c oxidase subunit 4
MAHSHAVRTYVGVFIALLVLTGATVGVSYVDLGPLSTVVALSIAVTKALLVLLFFMHLRDSPALTWIVAVGGFYWLGILIALTMSDVVTRSWLPVPGK